MDGSGLELLHEARWEEARAWFVARLEQEDDPEAHEGLGQALWFCGEIESGIAERERAYAGYVRDGRCDDAARVAAWVSHQRLLAGRASAARGWLSRAQRALEGVGPCAGHGWVAVERARHATVLAERLRQAERALAVARETGAGDLEVYALSLLGAARVSAGHQADGMDLLEEAMAAATAGQVSDVHVLGEAYCNLVIASTAAGDWERAGEWCAHVDAFARDHGAVPLIGACRTAHADVLVAAGRWPEAERTLQDALGVHERYIPEMGASTVACLAELRVRQGRIGEAERLLSGREEHPASLCALARLRLAQGEPGVAAGLLERGLRGAHDDVLLAARLLEPLVEARLAARDAAGAAAAAGDLATLAARTGSRVVQARAELAAARAAAADGRAQAAAEPARRALVGFRALDMPLDAGLARLELARALAVSSPDIAREEARSAASAFRALGALPALDAAGALLRRLGSAGPGPDELSAREREVLALVVEGLSNAQIAGRLVISEKTAGHHVSHILAKLGVRNRTEAATHAVRMGSG